MTEVDTYHGLALVVGRCLRELRKIKVAKEKEGE
jgi:hypothetical protein